MERERRMKDPIYYDQFQKIRLSIFPAIGTVINETKDLERKTYFMKQVLMSQGYDHRLFVTKQPFFYEEYSAFFQKLKIMPLLSQWTAFDRQTFSKWIIATISFRQSLEDRRYTQDNIQIYVDCMRAQFFPMIPYPDRVDEFNLPSLKEIKQLLYDNDIGYKQMHGKFYIKRFYKLPSLLFKRETLLTSLVMNRQVYE